MSADVSGRPVIEFPCPDYPVKVLGDSIDDFSTEVLSVVKVHAELSSDVAPLKPSRNGRFVSLTVNIIATGEPQLKSLHQALMKLSFVKMVM
ncbi:MAG TPA: DUF493 domain-containing protein [Marinagarivorans sp.]